MSKLYAVFRSTPVIDSPKNYFSTFYLCIKIIGMKNNKMFLQAIFGLLFMLFYCYLLYFTMEYFITISFSVYNKNRFCPFSLLFYCISIVISLYLYCYFLRFQIQKILCYRCSSNLCRRINNTSPVFDFMPNLSKTDSLYPSTVLC